MLKLAHKRGRIAVNLRTNGGHVAILVALVGITAVCVASASTLVADASAAMNANALVYVHHVSVIKGAANCWIYVVRYLSVFACCASASSGANDECCSFVIFCV